MLAVQLHMHLGLGHQVLGTLIPNSTLFRYVRKHSQSVVKASVKMWAQYCTTLSRRILRPKYSQTSLAFPAVNYAVSLDNRTSRPLCASKLHDLISHVSGSAWHITRVLFQMLRHLSRTEPATGVLTDAYRHLENHWSTCRHMLAVFYAPGVLGALADFA